MTERLVTVIMAVLLLMIALAACGPAPASVEDAEVVSSTEAQIRQPSPAVPAEPVTLDSYSASEIPTLDPQLADDIFSVNYVENLFVNLTDLSPDGRQLLPEAATGWQGSEDGLAYTFTLRTDIPWVQHDAETGETRQILDERGNPRFVTAHDFAHATSSRWTTVQRPNPCTGQAKTPRPQAGEGFGVRVPPPLIPETPHIAHNIVSQLPGRLSWAPTS
ncbi:MAG: hypothetical protein PVH59_03165 [Anaerolineae bacterium]|jgi:ABC-type oligopeptide transport system substrate-binding subunit